MTSPDNRKRSFSRKVKDFFTVEALGGTLLVVVTIVALVMANSGVREIYFGWLEQEVMVGFVDAFNLSLTVHEWINDGLMTIFFVVVGLEIKRELLVGELSSVKSAAMPMIAALGGMVVPALLFAVFNTGTETSKGWGIPVATDIAYALGILSLLRSRVPLPLKVFLTALAIADDIGAIIVISLFYSADIAWLQIAAAGTVFLLLILMNRLHVKALVPYIVVGLAFWLCFVHSGIHPTIAGVLFAFTVPVKPGLTTYQFKLWTRKNLEEFRSVDFRKLDPIAREEQQHIMDAIGDQARQASPLLLRMERGLRRVNYHLVIPVFALANAGVTFDIPIGEVLSEPLALGIICGLVLGKVLGITGFSFLGAKLGFAYLPAGVSWKHVIGMGFLAGIGFTLSLFITNLAFVNPEFIKTAKIAILSASLLAGLSGIIILLLVGKREEDTSGETAA